MKILRKGNILKLSLCRVTFNFDSSSDTSQDELTGPGVVGVCQIQDGSRTMTSVVQYAFIVAVN